MKIAVLEKPIFVPVTGLDPDFDGPAISMSSDEGEEWALMGLAEYAPRKANAWIWFTDAGHDHAIEIMKTAKPMLDAELTEGRWTRLQALIPVIHAECLQVARSFGFEVEGICLKAGPNDEDCILYGRVT